MRKGRETRAEAALEGLSWWFRDNWKVVLLLLGLAGLILAVGLWAARNNAQPAVAEEATVVRFGAYSSDEGARPAVVVRMKDGSIQQLGVHGGSIQSCRTGSRIRLIRRGAAVTVDPRGCSLPSP